MDSNTKMVNMNNKQILLLVVVLVGITIWNIPNTTSIFYNQHNFYNGSAPCQKCHQDIQDILALPDTPIQHFDLGCRSCHTRDGNTSHAASISTCINCHSADFHSLEVNGFLYKCIDCHGSHASYNVKETHRVIVAESCASCHRFV